MYLSRGFGATPSGSVPDLISAAAARYGVPSSLALAVAQKESSFNQAAIGSSGEVGVFQLMPGTAAQLGVNASDLNQNVDGGVRLLSQLYAKYGDWNTALEAYNAGPGNLQAGASYATSVLALAGPLDQPDTSSGDLTADTSDSGLDGSLSPSSSTPGVLIALGVAAGVLLLAVAAA